MSDSNSSNGGVSLLGLLGVAFIVLKLTDVIGWSWWYVTLPLWGGTSLLIVALLIYLAFKLIVNKVNHEIPTSNPYKDRPVRKSIFQERLEEAAKKKNGN